MILSKTASDSANDSGLALPSRRMIATLRQLDDSRASIHVAEMCILSMQSNFASASDALQALRPKCKASAQRRSFARQTERLSKKLKNKHEIQLNFML